MLRLYLDHNYVTFLFQIEEKLKLSFQNMMFIRKDDTLVTERKGASNNKHMYKLEASKVN